MIALPGSKIAVGGVETCSPALSGLPEPSFYEIRRKTRGQVANHSAARIARTPECLFTDGFPPGLRNSAMANQPDNVRACVKNEVAGTSIKHDSNSVASCVLVDGSKEQKVAIERFRKSCTHVTNQAVGLIRDDLRSGNTKVVKGCVDSFRLKALYPAAA